LKSTVADQRDERDARGFWSSPSRSWASAFSAGACGGCGPISPQRDALGGRATWSAIGRAALASGWSRPQLSVQPPTRCSLQPRFRPSADACQALATAATASFRQTAAIRASVVSTRRSPSDQRGTPLTREGDGDESSERQQARNRRVTPSTWGPKRSLTSRSRWMTPSWFVADPPAGYVSMHDRILHPHQV